MNIMLITAILGSALTATSPVDTLPAIGTADIYHDGWKEKLWKDGVGAIDEHLNSFRRWNKPPVDNPYVWPASKHAWALNRVQQFFIEDTRHGGTAIAEAILGDYNPGGKLTVTFPRSVGQIPFNFPYKPNSQVDGGKGTGPEGNQSRVHGALWDFGFGMSYTTFEYSDLKLSKEVMAPDDSVQVSFSVTNTGSVKGDEVVQLYIHDCLSSITVYERQLRGFERIPLEPGETKTVTFTLTPKHLSLIDKDFRSVVEPGDFDILIGASSTDIRLQQKLRVK